MRLAQLRLVERDGAARGSRWRLTADGARVLGFPIKTLARENDLLRVVGVAITHTDDEPAQGMSEAAD